MTSLSSSSSFLILAYASLVWSWGGVGHELTGSLAQSLLSPGTASLLQKLIPEYNGDLGKAANWADKVKSRPEYKFSYELHFVDAKNAPPKDCSFDQERDCPDGKCVTGAIGNYTSRLSCRYNQNQRGEAAKFLMHFLGDLTQPLHTCDRARGGNDVSVRFDGKETFESPASPNPTKKSRRSLEKASRPKDAPPSTKAKGLNLHGIWDYSILEKRINEAYHGSTSAMLDHLRAMAKTSLESGEAAEWTSCLTSSSVATPLECAIAWTKDSSRINCDTVWKLYDENPQQDFGGKYYEFAWPIVEKQLVKAGVRAAKWFDANLKECAA